MLCAGDCAQHESLQFLRPLIQRVSEYISDTIYISGTNLLSRSFAITSLCFEADISSMDITPSTYCLYSNKIPSKEATRKLIIVFNKSIFKQCIRKEG